MVDRAVQLEEERPTIGFAPRRVCIHPLDATAEELLVQVCSVRRPEDRALDAYVIVRSDEDRIGRAYPIAEKLVDRVPGPAAQDVGQEIKDGVSANDQAPEVKHHLEGHAGEKGLEFSRA